MSKGRVLVIDDDEWVCRLLAVAMKETGFEITITENAADGFFRAVEEQPDCIVCDVDLPDHNGYWVAKKIRSHPSSIAMAPFVFLSGLDDREHRLEGFQVGGDAYLTKPFRIDEVVAQVDALIQMAARLKKARQSLASIPPPHVAMSGDLAQMSAGTLLTLLDLERRSGVLELKSSGKKALITISNGSVVGTTIDGVVMSPLETIRRAMVWSVGKFAFTPSDDPGPPPTQVTPINALLMEAARLEDEERAQEGALPSSSSRIASWKETMARGTPRPFPPPGGPSAADANLFTPRPPPEFPSTSPIPSIVQSIPEREPIPDMPPSAAVPTAPTGVRPPIPARSPNALPLPRATGFTPAPFAAVKQPIKPPVPPKPESAIRTPGASAVKPTMPAATSPAKLVVPTQAAQAGARPPKPALPAPRTAFGAQLRSLSPSRGMRAVSPPPAKVQPPPAVETPDSLDAGWSSPPESSTESSTDQEPYPSDPNAPPKSVK